MKVRAILAVVFLLSAGVFSQDPDPPTDSTTVSDPTTSVETTTEPSQTTATPVQTTTVPSQTTTTPSDTTTTSPDTTTMSPDTTTSPETSTQPPKTTSSTTPRTTSSSTTFRPTTDVPPVTTVPPIPVPETGTWNVTEGNTTCIRAVLQIRFKLDMKPTSYITLSPNATTTGSTCEGLNGTQELVLVDGEFRSASTVTFLFGRNGDDIFVENITLAAPSIVGTLYNDTRLFTVKSGSSYLCSTSADIELGGNVTMEVLHIQVEAFKTAGNTDFSTADECSADEPINDVVPIAVGCALLALVVVVLVAYLVGRRRSRQKGYQSV